MAEVGGGPHDYFADCFSAALRGLYTVDAIVVVDSLICEAWATWRPLRPHPLDYPGVGALFFLALFALRLLSFCSSPLIRFFPNWGSCALSTSSQ